MDLEIRHLRLILAIGEEGSVTRAGARLHVTQSALSHQLRYAEKVLGAPLFYRVSNRMILTPAGEKLFATAQAVLEDLQRVEEAIRERALNQRTVLRICTQSYTCYHWLPRALKLFEPQFPEVEVRVVPEATADPIRSLLNGKLDLAIFDEPSNDRQLIVNPIFEDELVVVMHPEHQLAARSYVEPFDFAGERLITYSLPNEKDAELHRMLTQAGVTIKKVYKVATTEDIIEMVQQGFGLSLLARWAVAPYIVSGRLCGVSFTKKGLTRQWFSAVLKTKSTPSCVKEFANLIAAKSRVYSDGVCLSAELGKKHLGQLVNGGVD